MANRNQNEEDSVSYDYPGWKRSPGESNEDYKDRIEDMENSLDGLKKYHIKSFKHKDFVFKKNINIQILKRGLIGIKTVGYMLGN